MSSSACLKTVTHSKVKVEEMGRKAVFLNDTKETFHVYTVDGCLVTNGSRADYVVTKEGVASVIVELKGRDIEHACEQIFATAEHPAVKPHLKGRLGFLIVCRRYPRFDTYVRRAQQRCVKTYKTGIKIVSDRGEMAVEAVFDV